MPEEILDAPPPKTVPATPNKEQVIARAFASRDRGFITADKELLPIAKAEWEKAGLKVVEITLDDDSTSIETMSYIASVVLGNENSDEIDFYDAVDNGEVENKYAFSIDLAHEIEDKTEINKLADAFRNLCQQSGVRYVVGAENMDDIPEEFKIPARTL